MVLGKRNEMRQQVSLLLKVYKRPWIEVYMQIGLCFDLTKSYDIIHHDALLGKLSLCGVRGKRSVWFKLYLTH